MCLPVWFGGRDVSAVFNSTIFPIRLVLLLLLLDKGAKSVDGSAGQRGHGSGGRRLAVASPSKRARRHLSMAVAGGCCRCRAVRHRFRATFSVSIPGDFWNILPSLTPLSPPTYASVVDVHVTQLNALPTKRNAPGKHPDHGDGRVKARPPDGQGKHFFCPIRKLC